ncbi:hypothetical protein [Paramicrobacterium chengjingii]|uniref:hypothetical protein n=1 Tax=Paramicrobacterium chengjingii TaxID=2769067 RepID=UPI0014213814|nr:hypothetical protein [Microbacterium chengjingii]
MNEVANMQTGELVDYRPLNPADLEQLIVEIGDRLEQSVPALREMWAERYLKEREFIEAHAKAMLTSKQATVAMARKEADLATMAYKQAFDDAKTTLHAAEVLQKALQSRLFGMQNINRVVASLYNAGGVGR